MADDLLFTPGAVTDAQLAAGRDWYLTQAKNYDITTEKQRTELKRFARPLQKLRTGIEARAKELTGATKRKIAAIDAEKRRLVQIVGGIEQEVLQPLNDYEAAEERRIETRNAAIKEIQDAGAYTQANWMALSVEAMRDRLKEIQSDSREWPELGSVVEAYREESIKLIADAIAKRETYDREWAELAKLRADAAARDAQARLDFAAQQAREQAERDAKAEVAAAEQRAADAERRAKEAAAQAERDKLAAVEAEKRRAAAEAAREFAIAEARAADKAHRAIIEQEAIDGLIADGLDAEASRLVVLAISEGRIPRIRIEY